MPTQSQFAPDLGHDRQAGGGPACGRDREGTHTFDSGAVRSADADATRYDLISPIALEAWAKTCAEGAAKYGDFNWERGMPAHDLLNHALRHIYMFLGGDRSEDHLPHALWNVGAAIHSLAIWHDLNNGTLRRPGCGVPIHNAMEKR